MQRHKIFTHSLLTGIALFNLSQIPQAMAETTWVQRGSHGAIQVVDRDRLPIGAMTLPHAGGQGSPRLVVKGPHGAVHLVNNERSMIKKMSEVQAPINQGMGMKLQSNVLQRKSTFRLVGRRSAEELLKISNPLI
jgi:hypothetical protein